MGSDVLRCAGIELWGVMTYTKLEESDEEDLAVPEAGWECSMLAFYRRPERVYGVAQARLEPVVAEVWGILEPEPEPEPEPQPQPQLQAQPEPEPEPEPEALPRYGRVVPNPWSPRDGAV